MCQSRTLGAGYTQRKSGQVSAHRFIHQQIFDALPQAQRDLLMAVGAEMEAFAMEEAKKDDVEVGKVYKKDGDLVVDLTPASIKKWQDLARETAWKHYASKNAGSAKLLALAEQTL